MSKAKRKEVDLFGNATTDKLRPRRSAEQQHRARWRCPDCGEEINRTTREVRENRPGRKSPIEEHKLMHRPDTDAG